MHGTKSKILLGIDFDVEHEEKLVKNRVLKNNRKQTAGWI